MSGLLKIDLSLDISDITAHDYGKTYKIRQGSLLAAYLNRNSDYFKVYHQDGDLWTKDKELVDQLTNEIKKQNKKTVIKEMTALIETAKLEIK